jgi:hypothetical protein
MSKIWWNYLYLAIGLFACLFFSGCVKTATPIIQSTKINLTEILPTPLKDAKFTSTPETGINGSAPHVSPYIKVVIEDVEVRYLETNPVQVELVIRGTLPDQCKYDFYTIENRVSQKIKISLSGIHPADNSCLQTIQSIEYALLLGRDMPELERGFPPGDYQLIVNNYQTSFFIK